MATYLYRYTDDQGGEFELVQSMKDDPLQEHEGRPVERVITGGIGGYTNPFDNKYPYVSSRLPRNLEGCRTDSAGKPVIESKQHEANLAARYGMRRE